MKQVTKMMCLLLLAILIAGNSNIKAQQISGVVTDESTNETLPGVNVLVKGTLIGTATNLSGEYSFTAPSLSDTLVFSFIGYETVEVPIDGRQNIDISLIPEALIGNDVIVVGYGTQRRRDITGSIASVSSDDIETYSTTDPAELIRGRVTGVQVKQNGEPGAAPSIQIRGVGTFGNNQPLYVIDGVPIGTSVRDFNPNDIESIQVLKDASAAAIYGSRAANGVVLVTTKQGRRNTPLQIDYSTYFGVDLIPETIPVVGREDYQMLSNEGQINGGQALAPGNDPNSAVFIDDINTDWQDVGLKNGQRTNHNLTLSGGGDYSTYSVSLDYLNSEGTLVGHGPDYERYSARVNSTLDKGLFEFGQSFYYTFTEELALNYNTTELTGGRPPMIVDLVTAIPTLGLYDESNVGGCAGTESDVHVAIILNVPCTNELLEGKVNVNRTFASAYAKANIIDEEGQSLEYKLNVSYDRTNVSRFNWVPEFEMGFFFTNSTARLDDGEDIFYTGLVENTLTYGKTFDDKHDLTLLAGHTYQVGGGIFRNITGAGFAQPYFQVVNAAATTSASGFENKYAFDSYFGRVNYNYDDRYLLTGTFRRDGVSRFAPGNRYGNFPSVSVGWNLHNETFFSLPEQINRLKLRASYGQLGNSSIGEYQYIGTINTAIPYNWNGSRNLGALQTQIANTDIQWETKTTSNIGIDATFLQNRFDFTAEYYVSNTTDILVGVPIPLSVGANNTPTTNAGELENRGLELSLTYRKMTGDFTFDLTGNFSTLSNEVVALGGDDEPIFGVATITEVGGEIGRHYGYKYDGIFQTQQEIDDHAFQNIGTRPGDIRFRDLNDDGVINDLDRTYLGSSIPSYSFGMNFSGRYKNFDFTVFASGLGGYKIHGRMYRMLMLPSDYLNYHEDMLDRWTPTNTDTDIPRRVAGDPNNNGRDSDRPGWLQDGLHLRINTIAVGYTLPVEARNFLGGLRDARVYARAQNVYTFQKYKGFNPDFTSGVFEPAFDNGSYPVPRSFMVGLELGF